VLLFALLLPTAPFAADVEGSARVSLWGLVDTNARREYDGGEIDLLASALGAVDGGITFESARLMGRYDLGARKFARNGGEDALVQAAEGEASLAIGRTAGVGILGRGRDRRGGSRSFSDLGALAFLDFVPDATVSIRASGGARRFIYWRVFRHSFAATEMGATARYRIDRLQALHVFGELALRRHNANAQAREVPPAGSEECLGTRPLDYRRADTFVRAGLGWSMRGRVPLTLTYSYTQDDSNSFGESWRQHRLAGTAGFRLPWEMTLLAQLSIQVAEYPDGIFLSPEVVVEEDAENFNALSLKLARPLASSIDIELKWSIYYSQLPRARLDGLCAPGGLTGVEYMRQLFWLGATWRYER
jgi:hypothetical protein